MEDIIGFDKELFLSIHLGLQNAVCDFLAPLFRNKIFWIPLYLLVLSYIWYNFRSVFWKVVLAVVLLVTATDSISSKVVKPLVGRERPCQDSEIRLLVRPMVPCGGGKSFTSSHATNHFGLGVFLMLLFGHLGFRHQWIWLVWASIISLSQVYVGLHYVSDIFFGGILGALLGLLTFKTLSSFIRTT
jgi:membrane-associated phospholipid phosphatase